MEEKMRTIDKLLSEYGESHQNETNKAVHWVCVPVIVWCVLALLYTLPFPNVLKFAGWVNWASLLLLVSCAYYCVLSFTLALGMLAFSAASLWLLSIYALPLPLWQFALGLFVAAWIGQFWGHKIEGKKPSFFKDVQFLMIGPAWLLHFLYKKVGIPY
jgi:uncharacterized membrane protein YGL010W